MEKESRNMHRMTKKTAIGKNARQEVKDRDEGCIFCMMEYHMPESEEIGLYILDIMHFIPRSQGGMGIPENLAVGCRYHHNLLDNGNKGYRAEMLDLFGNYLRRMYPGWNRDKLIYRKV